ncbi:MAG: hypothetical protein DWQ10_03335 [Calditrichaeota bacterium]|nr:MAG: hypothetical protein DWQ10_03335 [Calditrichota bacterium]
MKAKEILCLAILPEDVKKAFKKISRTIKPAHQKHIADYLQNLEKNICKESVLLALSRFLRTHGIAHKSRPKIGEHCIIINGKIICLVLCPVAGDGLTVEELVDNPVFLETHLWEKRENFHRFLFVFINKAFSVSLKTELHNVTKGCIKPQDFHMNFARHRLFLTAAPSSSEIDKRFRPVPKGTVCLQATWGLDSDMPGAKIMGLTPFVQVFDWHGV